MAAESFCNAPYVRVADREVVVRRYNGAVGRKDYSRGSPVWVKAAATTAAPVSTPSSLKGQGAIVGYVQSRGNCTVMAVRRRRLLSRTELLPYNVQRQCSARRFRPSQCELAAQMYVCIQLWGHAVI